MMADETVPAEVPSSESGDVQPADPESLMFTDTDKSRARRVRPKLDIHFFKSKDDDDVEVDRGWELFLDVAALFPTLQERIASSGCDDMNAAAAAHLDDLLLQLRRWTQSHFPAGLSLREFGERVEKCSASNAFHDYRTELIHRYKTTDWKTELATRRTSPTVAAPVDPPSLHDVSETTQKVPSNAGENAGLTEVRKRREELLRIQRARHSASTLDAATHERQLKLKRKRQQMLEKLRLQHPAVPLEDDQQPQTSISKAHC